MLISQVIIGPNRHRKHMGDLDALAASIKEQGLLQPIGVDETGLLVFGERRLLACRDIIGWTEIDARVVKVTSIVEGEFAENEVRKAFTVSERAAIADAVAVARGDQRGGDRKSEDFQEGQTAPLISPKRTKDLAAKAAGLGSRKTLERAERVLKSGDQELIDKMDRREITIHAAEKVIRDRDKSERERLKSLIPPGPKKRKPGAQKVLTLHNLVLDALRGVSRGGFVEVLKLVDSIREYERKDAAASLRALGHDLLRYADILWKEELAIAASSPIIEGETW